MALVPGHQRDHLVGNWLNRLADADFGAAVEWFKRMPDGRGKQQALQQFAWRWAQSAPEDAAAYALTVPAGRARDDFLRGVAGQWANNDPEAALRWAAGLGDQRLQREALSTVVSAWSGQSPVEAASYVAQLPEGPLQNQAAASVASSWAGEDPAAALAWVQGFGDDDLRRSALQTVVSQWANNDPAGAGAWVRQQPAGPQRDAMVGGLARNLAFNDPGTASEWANLLGSESPEFASVASAIASAWANQDSAGGNEWLKTLPEGQGREAAVNAYVHSVQHSEPALAATWAATLNDPQMRQHLVEMSVGQWIEQDASRAEQWLRKAEIPAELRNRLMEQAQAQRR
jgi:hypothetical protein